MSKFVSENVSFSQIWSHIVLFTHRSVGFQGFHRNPLLKFIYSNRAVRSRLFNRAVGLKCSNLHSNNASKTDERRVLKLMTFIFFFWSSTQSGLEIFFSPWPSWNPLLKILNPPLQIHFNYNKCNNNTLYMRVYYIKVNSYLR